MKSFTHYNAKSSGEAVKLLVRYEGRAVLNAGGTDLIGALKDEILPLYPEAVINIKTIPGLAYIKEQGRSLQIGALTGLSDIAGSALIKEKYGSLAEAARLVATPQIRNAATIGGNLCQDVRCWYYRYPSHIGGAIGCARKGNGPCLAVKGDNRYHAIFQGKRCFAVCPSDTAVALAALDATIKITGPDGKRTVTVEDFYNPMGNALKTGEMVTAIEIPKAAGMAGNNGLSSGMHNSGIKRTTREISEEGKQRFLKFVIRQPVDFAVISVAVVITTREGVVSDARIALGAVAAGPVRARSAEEFLCGRIIDEDIAKEAARYALERARPLSGNGYKIEIAKTLVKRAIMGINGKEAAHL